MFALAKLGHFRESHPASRVAREVLGGLDVSAEVFAEAVGECVGLLLSVGGGSGVSGSVDSVVPKKRRKRGGEGGGATSAMVVSSGFSSASFGSSASSRLSEEEEKLERVGDVLQVLVGRELQKCGVEGLPTLLSSLLNLLSTLMTIVKEGKVEEGGKGGKKGKGKKNKSGGELSFRFVFVLHLCLGCVRSLFMFLRTGSEQQDALSSFNNQNQEEQKKREEEERKGGKKKKGGKKEGENKKKSLPSEWKEVSGKVFTIEQLVDFFTSSTDVQTNNLALLLIAEITRCYPKVFFNFIF